ncbi:MAG: hypothetical protein WC479_03645 [Candidatus Izemoplasmatales bacterium]
MKKRLLILLLMLFAAVGVIACTPSEETTTPTDITTTTPTELEIPDVAGIPTNLVITGKVLTWTTAANATGYIVYVDGVEQVTVTTNTYDFTALTGDGLIFTVASVGAQGFENSHQSASVAYIANPAEEVTDITAYLSANLPDFPVPPAAVTELVRKGVTADDLETDLSTIMTFVAALQASEGEPAAIKTALEAMIASLTNYEAYISALITVLPSLMDDMISSLEDVIAMMEDDNTLGEYDQQLATMNQQLDMIVNLQTAIETNSDQIVVALTNVVTYLFDFEAAINVTLFNNIVDMTSDGAEPTPAEIVTLKNDIVDFLLLNLPEAADIGLLYQVVILLEAAVMDKSPAPMLELSNEFGYSCVLSMEFTLQLLRSFDVAFVTDTITIVESGWSEDKTSVEVSIHFMNHIAAFMTANQTLIDSIDAVYSTAQQAIIFDEFSAIMNLVMEFALSGNDFDSGMNSDSIAAMVMMSILSGLQYDSFSGATAVIESQAEKFFDYLVATDGELLRLIGISNGFEHDYEFGYINSYSETEYPNTTEYYEAKDDVQIALVEEMMLLLDSTIATLTDTETGDMIDFIASLIPLDLIISSGELDITLLQMQDFLASLVTVLKAQDQGGMMLLNSFLDFLVSEDVFDNYAIMQTEVRTYYTSEYGADYYNIYEFLDDPYEEYSQVIFFSGLLYDFMNQTNLTMVQTMITSAFTFMKTTNAMAVSGMTIDQINAMETNVNTMITQVLSLAGTVKTYDVDTLTADEIDDILMLMELFSNNQVE